VTIPFKHLIASLKSQLLAASEPFPSIAVQSIPLLTFPPNAINAFVAGVMEVACGPNTGLEFTPSVNFEFGRENNTINATNYGKFTVKLPLGNKQKILQETRIAKEKAKALEEKRLAEEKAKHAEQEKIKAKHNGMIDIIPLIIVEWVNDTGRSNDFLYLFF
jgi:hypothetical protein